MDKFWSFLDKLYQKLREIHDAPIMRVDTLITKEDDLTKFAPEFWKVEVNEITPEVRTFGRLLKKYIIEISFVRFYHQKKEDIENVINTTTKALTSFMQDRTFDDAVTITTIKGAKLGMEMYLSRFFVYRGYFELEVMFSENL